MQNRSILPVLAVVASLLTPEAALAKKNRADIANACGHDLSFLYKGIDEEKVRARFNAVHDQLPTQYQPRLFVDEGTTKLGTGKRAKTVPAYSIELELNAATQADAAAVAAQIRAAVGKISMQITNNCDGELSRPLRQKIAETSEKIDPKTPLQHLAQQAQDLLQRKEFIDDGEHAYLAVHRPGSNQIETISLLKIRDAVLGWRYENANGKASSFAIQVAPDELNGVNTPFEVTAPTGYIVLASKVYIQSEGKRQLAVSTPATEGLMRPEVLRAGMDYLVTAVKKAHTELREVPSRRFPNQAVAEVVPPEVAIMLALIEHMDERLYFEPFKNAQDKEWKSETEVRAAMEKQIKEVLVILATNGENAYGYSRSSARANGLSQIMPGTYQLLHRAYPRADLTPDFAAGTADHVNALKATILHLDDEAAQLRVGGPGQELSKPEIGALLAGGYNSNAAALAKQVDNALLAKLQKPRAGWVDRVAGTKRKPNRFPDIPQETQVYMQKYLFVAELLEEMGYFPLPSSKEKPAMAAGAAAGKPSPETGPGLAERAASLFGLTSKTPAKPADQKQKSAREEEPRAKIASPAPQPAAKKTEPARTEQASIGKPVGLSNQQLAEIVAIATKGKGAALDRAQKGKATPADARALLNSKGGHLKRAENAAVEAMQLPKYKTLAALKTATGRKQLVALPEQGTGYQIDFTASGVGSLDPKNKKAYAVLTPHASLAFQQLARDFHRTFGGTLRVTSMTRTEDYLEELRETNTNASSKSAHLHGATLDISYLVAGKNGKKTQIPAKQMDWLRAELARLAAAGQVIAIEEKSQACFHITFLQEAAAD